MRHSTLSTFIRLAAIPAAIAIGFSVPAAAADAQYSAANQASSGNAAADTFDYRGLRASEMINMSVRNAQGENIGQIGDMIVDMNTGDVRYAILRFDPGVFESEELYAVPTTELRIAPDRNDVIYKMDEERLEAARIDDDDWDADGWADFDRFDKVYGIAQPTRGARAHRVSDLIGKDVNNKSGDKIGEIEELIVNMAEQQVHYAVLEFDPSWASPEQNYAFQLTAFNLTDGKDELVLDVTKAKLAQMKSFPDSRFASRDSLNDRVWVADIDRYFVTVLPTVVPAALAGQATSLFARLDDDNNGSLSKAEVKDSADVDRNWTRFDKNGDDRIDRAEFSSNYTIDPMTAKRAKN